MNSSEVVFSGRRFRVVRLETRADDGSTHVREIVEHPGSVTIVPLVDGEHVCLIRNRRPGVGEWLIELPAGTREPDEPPEETARREILEETGYRAGAITRLAEFWMSPGILNERMSLYLATDLEPAAQALDPGEEIEPLVVAWTQAVDMIADGRIHDAKTIAGLLYYERFRDRVNGSK